MTGIPYHMAIIMDGNRRWAHQQNVSVQSGHEEGSRVIRNVAERASEHGVTWLTLFAFSSENWKRSSLELKGIMTVLHYYLQHEFHVLEENNVKLRIIGDVSGFSDDICKLLDQSVRKTAKNTGLNLTIALGYGGQTDIAQAAQQIARLAVKGQLEPATITEDDLKTHMMTASLPAVDLLLRTGGEQRMSNFLLWDMAYAELIFSDVMWPDFTPSMLDDVLDQFARRDRRYGGGVSNEMHQIRAKIAHS